MVDPIQRPLDSLMLSAQKIANDSSIADDEYVYMKNGKVHTEGKFKHAFTFISTKAKTSQTLASAFTRYYGDSGSEARLAFNKSLYGMHQMKVGDLRQAFRKAESAKLTALSDALYKSYGNAIGNALLPLTDHVLRGGSVTQKMIGQAMDQVFGKGVSAIVMKDQKGFYLESMAELMSKASEVKDQVAFLQNGKPRVLEAFFYACRKQWPLTKDSVLQTAEKFFSVSAYSGMTESIRSMREKAENPTLEEAYRFFDEGYTNFQRSKIDEFQRRVVKDESLGECLGLREKRTACAELSAEEVQRIRRQLPQLREAAKRVRSAASRFVKEHPTASGECKKLAKECAEEAIRARSFGPAEVQTVIQRMLVELQVRYRLETEFDFGVEYYQNTLHADWTAEQKSFFADVLAKIRSRHSGMDLFTAGNAPVAQRVAKYIDGENLAHISDVAALGRDAEILYIETLVFTDDVFAPMLLEKLPEILRGKDAAEVTFDDIAQSFSGERANISKDLAAEAYYSEVGRWVYAMQDQRISTAPESLQAAKTKERELHPDAGDDDIESRAKKRVAAELEQTGANIRMAFSSGLSVEAAFVRNGNRDRPLVLDDLALKPNFSKAKSRQTAVHDWVVDFYRQGETKKGRNAIGTTQITVTESNNRKTFVHNGSDGMSAEELEKFNAEKITPRHQQLVEALVRLCGENEAQCSTAISLLGQAGPVGLNKTFAGLVTGASPDEHAAMIYSFSKNDRGEVILDMHSPEDPQKARLEVKTVIHADGTADVVDFSFLSPAAQQEKKLQEAAANGNAAGNGASGAEH